MRGGHMESHQRLRRADVESKDDTTEVHPGAATRVDQAAVTKVDGDAATLALEAPTTELKVVDKASHLRLGRVPMPDVVPPGEPVKTTGARPSAMRLAQLSPDAIQQAARKAGYVETENADRARSRSRMWLVAIAGGVVAAIVASLAIRAWSTGEPPRAAESRPTPPAATTAPAPKPGPPTTSVVQPASTRPSEPKTPPATTEAPKSKPRQVPKAPQPKATAKPPKAMGSSEFIFSPPPSTK